MQHFARWLTRTIGCLPGAGRPSGLAPVAVTATLLASVLGVVPAASSAAGHPASAVDQANWLHEINVYREASGLSGVAAQPSWDLGLQHHLLYLQKTPKNLISGLYASLHTENPLSPYYTADGASEGAGSDLELGGIRTPLQAIQGWLTTPFHAIGMLRPQLTTVGLALSDGYAGLDVIHGIDYSLPRPSRPILFPGPGMTTNLTAYRGEYPNPLETCGWRGTAGLPLIVLLPSSPSPRLSATLSGPGGTSSTSRGSLCVVDERTFRTTDPVYGPTGRQILLGDHAVLLIPRHALRRGRYAATATQAGQRAIRWSFSVNPGAGAARR